MRTKIIAGDTLAFDTLAPVDSEGESYRASAGWEMTYRLVPRTSTDTAVSFTASADGDDYTVSVSAATTADWAAGWYTYFGYVTKGATTYEFERGQVEIAANPRTVAAGFDDRSHARKVLDAIEALLENRATSDHKRVVINGRELERFPIADLVKLRQTYRFEVQREDDAARIQAGLASRNRIYVRM